MKGSNEKACICTQGAMAAAAAAEEERRECVGDMRALLDAEIATASAVLDHAAVEKAVAEARRALCAHFRCFLMLICSACNL